MKIQEISANIKTMLKNQMEIILQKKIDYLKNLKSTGWAEWRL